MKMGIVRCYGEGSVTAYKNKLLEVGIELIPSDKTDDYGSPLYYVEVNTIEDLLNITKATDYDLVIERPASWNDNETWVRIYDGYLE